MISSCMIWIYISTIISTFCCPTKEVSSSFILCIFYEQTEDSPESCNSGSGLKQLCIWVSFPRTGICPDLCNFFKKFGNLLLLNQKINPCILNCFWEILSLRILGQISGSPRHHYTTLHYTQVYSCTLHYTILLYSTRVYFNVVKSSGFGVTLKVFLVI